MQMLSNYKIFITALNFKDSKPNSRVVKKLKLKKKNDYFK